jgi:TolB-like protein/DNA-binding winged helix-turn-helix (wHTH) protein
MAALMDQDQISFGPFRFDLGDSKLSFQGAPISLGSRALDILRVLALAKGNVVSKDRLLDAVWPGLAVEENNIQVHISALRKELDKRTDGESFIVTVPGRGYRLVGLERPPETDQSGIRDTLGLVIPGASIAVLPFQNMSGDPGQDCLADGLTEDIITGLSRQRWFSVVARNASFAFRGEAIDVRAVARELGVRYVLEGSLRMAADRVRITAQLIDATNAFMCGRTDTIACSSMVSTGRTTSPAGSLIRLSPKSFSPRPRVCAADRCKTSTNPTL